MLEQILSWCGETGKKNQGGSRGDNSSSEVKILCNTASNVRLLILVIGNMLCQIDSQNKIIQNYANLK